MVVHNGCSMADRGISPGYNNIRNRIVLDTKATCKEQTTINELGYELKLTLGYRPGFKDISHNLYAILSSTIQLNNEAASNIRRYLPLYFTCSNPTGITKWDLAL